ncbi:MAG TPA: TIGR01777 family oxidoreductase [Solirubrobacteraceae bacterium]|nr:TIGR01777 family oxidoreductase [Solirubrobacteraceae bacterium]
MQVTVTGASGLIGRRLVAAMRSRGDDVVVLSRDRGRALDTLQQAGSAPAPSGGLRVVAWDPLGEPAPTAGLSGSDAIVHLAGENIAQRWTTAAKRAIRASRVDGTRGLVRGIAELDSDHRPSTLLSGSAIGYYGPRGDEPIDEDAPAGAGFLAQTCAAWEAEADAAAELGLRVVKVRTGVVLDPSGGALAKMLPPFKLGVGGPVAGGRQYVSWVEPSDLVGIMLAALDQERWRGAINATAPEPVRNGELAKTLGRVLGRPALLPVPKLALQALYGEMSEVVTSGARVLPARALMEGYEFRYAKLEPALRAALNRR